jgi:hypothetical protein
MYMQHVGLTKRELFAAMAMQGMAAIDTVGRGDDKLSPRWHEWMQGMATDAVGAADALLAELEKSNGTA